MGAFENFSGKVSAQVFKEELIGKTGFNREEVICGPQFGVDTSIVDLGNGKALAISSDPLSLIPDLGMKISAWLSVHLIVNDMSTTGCAPQYAQFVLNLPSSLSREKFGEYWNYIHTLCEELQISITGGHTGQIPGQDSTISGGGTFFLQTDKNRIITSNGAQQGDSIILTKHAALSSTSLLALAFPNFVKESLGEPIQKAASENFWKLSVLPESLVASRLLKPKTELTAMHDVTEGGVLGGIVEMANASGLGVQLFKENIPLPEEVYQVANLFEIDPLLSIGAGAMLMAVKPGFEELLIQELKKEGIPASLIGNFTRSTEKQILENGTWSPIKFEGEDPYWEAYFNAMETGKT